MAEDFYVRIDHPWDEPQDPPLEPPTDAQVRDGVAIVMLMTSGGNRTFRKGERYLASPENAENLVGIGYARYETKREERIALAEGQRRGAKQTGVKAKPAKPKKAERAKGE